VPLSTATALLIHLRVLAFDEGHREHLRVRQRLRLEQCGERAIGALNARTALPDRLGALRTALGAEPMNALTCGVTADPPHACAQPRQRRASGTSRGSTRRSVAGFAANRFRPGQQRHRHD
jgi:hypothetical protein